jgi:ABC-2 type transport system permease protein
MFNLHLYLRLISVSMRSQMQYRLSFLMDAFGVMFATLIEFIVLAAVFTRFGHLGGWRLGEVAFLYGLVETAFATMDMIFSGFDPDYFSGLIQRGQFDQMLLRPVGLRLQMFGQVFMLRRLGRIAQGVFVFGLSLALVHVDWTPGKLLYLPVVVASAIAFFGGLFVVGATLCFWTVQSLEAINIFTYGGTTMLAYPMHIYGAWMQRFFTFIVPGALLIYYPALYFLGKPDPLGLPPFTSFLAPLAGFGVLAAAFAFWNFGVRKYTSTET